jgi:hypothetical protein
MHGQSLYWYTAIHRQSLYWYTVMHGQSLYWYTVMHGQQNIEYANVAFTLLWIFTKRVYEFPTKKVQIFRYHIKTWLQPNRKRLGFIPLQEGWV